MTPSKSFSLEKFIPNILFGLNGQHALVIGAGGLGEVAAFALAAAGARLSVADIDDANAKKAARKITEAGGEAQFYKADVTKKASIEDLVETVANRTGRIHVAVLSAGITHLGAPEDFEEEDWDRVVTVNLKGTFLCCQAAGRHMLENGGGAIINFSSITGQRGIKNTPAYSASKGGVDQLTRSLAIEWSDRGVRVNAVAPSYFRTDLVNELEKDPENRKLFEQRLKRVPLGRMGEPVDLAGAILFLASPAAAMVTGAIIPIDGGFLAA